jgi:hypothetical protein
MAEVELLATLRGGGSAVLEAVPGAGKTTLMLATARALATPERRALVLAYNRQLAASVRARLADAEHVSCLTFHALCARCLGPARDDAQLEAAVRAAEEGRAAPHDVPEHLGYLFVDEAQDVRPLFVRLLRALGLVGGARRQPLAVLVAGDAHQLIFDWDPRHAATLDTLRRPEVAFAAGGGPWARCALDESRRLPRPVVDVVNAVFGTAIRSAKPGPAVEVRAPRSAFQLFEALRDVLLTERDVMLLVDRKKGNRPLRALLNALCRAGRRVHVHGVDEAPASEGAVRCATWWGAKGLECDVAVVLLPPEAATNPTYVALTRASRRLVLVLDPKAPHAAVCAACDPALAVGGTARALLTRRFDADEVAASLRRPPEWARGGEDRLEVVDDLAPPDAAEWSTVRWREGVGGVGGRRPGGGGDDPDDEVALVVEPEGGLAQDVRAAVVRAALVACEYASAGGRVRAFEDVLHPTRLDADQADAAVRLGFAGRWVPRAVPDDALLADDLRASAARAYARFETLEDVFLVALATMAWDGFEHVFRQHLPLAGWVATTPRVAEALRIARAALPAEGQYDVRLRDATRQCRVHAADASACYHVVWGAAADDEARAAVRAALHPARRCVLVDLHDGRLADVTVP